MNAHAAEQQVNLYQPILGAEKRLFSAKAIGAGLALLIVSLAAMAIFGSVRIGRIERSVDLLARQEAASISLAERASVSARPAGSMAQLDAEAKELSADIDAREQVLEVVRRSSSTPATGFAARLEALARRQLDGVWLNTIVLGSGEGRLAMRGAATDARLIPQYLIALAGEAALAGVLFDKIDMQQALPADAPARVVFELDGPGLAVPAKAHGK